MRWILIAGVLLLAGCGPGLTFNLTEMTREEMLDRASHVFVGVIEGQHLDSWPLFRLNVPGEDPGGAKYWKILRRKVRIETMIRGTEPRKLVDVYEIFWTGGASGNWNSTREGERDLFLVRVENGRYHVVRDWWRSIFRITTGPHARLPLDESHPLWERIDLLEFWMESADPRAWFGIPHYNQFDLWRTAKLLRGLVRYPIADVRTNACYELMLMRLGQDECWDQLSESDRKQLIDDHRCCFKPDVEDRRRRFRQGGMRDWSIYKDQNERRLLTAVSDKSVRAEFCRLYAHEYPGDTDNGCPADRPPPATIVAENGDVPLLGNWPQ